MVNYNQRDVRVKLDDADLFCDSISLKYDATISPNYNVFHGKNAYNFSAGKAGQGSVDLEYFLTGSDPLVDKMSDPKTPVSISFGGLTVGSGYLGSYSFSAEPFAPVKAKVQFNFFQEVDGTFSPSQSELISSETLSVSDMSLEGGNIATINNVKNFSYGYKSSLTPTYAIASDGATNEFLGVTSKASTVSVDFALYDYDLSLPSTGIQESFKINLKDKNSVSKQLFYVDGPLRNKSIGARVNDRVSSNYSINQGKLGGETPSITAHDPVQGLPGGSLSIYGSNILNATSAWIGNHECKIKSRTVHSSLGDHLQIDIPHEMLKGEYGAVSVRTESASVTFTNYMFKASEGMSNF
jgi:hypothetical protein